MSIGNDGTDIKVIVDTGSPVAILPPDKEIIKGKKRLPVTKKYQYVNKTEVKIPGNLTVEAESEGIKKIISVLFSKGEDSKLLLGMGWLREFNWTIRLSKSRQN